MAELLYGKPVAQQIFAQTEEKASKLPFAVRLATVGFSNAQWLQYVGALAKSGASCGIEVENICADGLSPQQFTNLVAQVSARQDVHGVLLQQPLPPQFASAVECIPPSKDVDCLNSVSVAKLYKGENCVCPATPTAVLNLLDFYGVQLQGKNVVVVGRGAAVGRPLALMCLKRNATVTICHTKTQNLSEICRRADILISACGVAGLVNEQFVTKNSIVVDVGLSFVDGKTCGDVSQNVWDIVRAVSPVPGGVGPVTRAALFDNLISAVLNK